MRNCYLIDLTPIADFKLSLSSGYLESFALTSDVVLNSYLFYKRTYYLGLGAEEIINLFLNECKKSSRTPDVVGFTIYFWNRTYSLKMAARIKETYPDCLIILGGNDVSFQGEEVLKDQSHIDIIVNGEGEQVFLNLLEWRQAGKGRLTEICGITARDESQNIFTTKAADRIVNLDSIPSPFLSGGFSKEEISSSGLIIYETNRGCPFDCAFCFWGAATASKVRSFSLERIKKELELIASVAKPHTTLFLADANFGMLTRDVEIARYLANLVKMYGKPLYLFANWAKNSGQRVVDIAKILFESKIISAVTLSAQTFNQDVLKIANRKNIPFQYYQQLQETFKEHNIPTYTELLLGMPGESYESYKDGIDKVLEAGGTAVVYPLLVLNNTEYSKPEIRQLYKLKTRWMPYQIDNTDMKIEFVIANETLAEEEWLRGMELRLVISFFHNVLLKATMRYINSKFGIKFTMMAEILLNHLNETSSLEDPTFLSVFKNYRKSLIDYHQYDSNMIDTFIGTTGIREHHHYQAMMKLLFQDEARICSSVEYFTSILTKAIAKEVDYNESEIKVCVAFQQMIGCAICALIQNKDCKTDHRIRNQDFKLISKYVTDLSLQFDPLASIYNFVLRDELFDSNFDRLALAFYHGSIDSLGLFKKLGSKAQTQTAQQ